MKRKLNYRFHNPNSAEVTTEFLCKLLVEVNIGKVERAIEEVARECDQGSKYIEKNMGRGKSNIRSREKGRGAR